MYDRIKFEINTITYVDILENFPVEYPYYDKELMSCLVDNDYDNVGIICVPISEEYRLREWLLTKGVVVIKCHYVLGRESKHDHKKWLIETLTNKKEMFEKYLEKLDYGDYPTTFKNNNKYKLIYYDVDGIASNCGMYSGIIDLYKKAITIFDLAILKIKLCSDKIKNVSCGISGFYSCGGRNPQLLDLDLQLSDNIRLFDFNITFKNMESKWKCSLMAELDDQCKTLNVTNKTTHVYNNYVTTNICEYEFMRSIATCVFCVVAGIILYYIV